MIEIKNLSAGYGKVVVLRDVNITVNNGECVGIIGPNGSGKSTLLRSISGITNIMQGSILQDGVGISKKLPWTIAKAGIAHVPEGRLLFADMTVEENMLVAMDSVQTPKSQHKERFERVWELFPILKTKWQDKAGALSGGQQQMVAVGRGLVVNPKVLLLDEPSLGLAPIVIQEIRRAIERLKGSDMSIVVADQNASLVLLMTDKVYIIAEGQVTREGSSAEIAENEGVWKAYMHE